MAHACSLHMQLPGLHTSSAANMLVTVYVEVQAEQQEVSSQLSRSLSQADSPEPLGAAYDCQEELPGQEVACQVRPN